MAKLIVLVVVACTLAVETLGAYPYAPYGSGQASTSAVGSEFNQQSAANENHDKKTFGLNFSSDKGSTSSSNNVNAQAAGANSYAQGQGVGVYPQPYQQVQYPQQYQQVQYPQQYQQVQYPQSQYPVANQYATPYQYYPYTSVQQVPQSVPQVQNARPITGGWGR